MRSSAIARRYARALILIGKDDGQAEKYREELDGFIAVLDAQPVFEQTIGNPLYGTQSRRAILKAVIEKFQLSDVIRSFLLLLFDKQRFFHVRGIMENYARLADELKGVVRASLLSATELEEDTIDQIRGALSKMTGKDVILDAGLDPALIGGVVTRIGDLVLDGSIRTQLKNMSQSLKRGERV
ncbi:MAG: ATP synthase F1 subunit delta [Deltaproteobacteria bacterium]|nr:ATP synthase F1 subunit delta [Deltaproteobacteria bacterium]